ncbi:MAG: plastocyanin [Ramlibacter sp.]|nr:plastocyanin [Ramlibacter sp.]
MKLSKALLAMAVLTAALAAGAHGSEDHAKKAGPVRKEQKAFGIAGDSKAVKRTVRLTMSDSMRFTPDVIDVRQGDTIRITLNNSGQVLHEMVIGTKQELEEHAALMVRFPNMEHDEPYMAHVKPGSTGEIVWTFNRPGSFDFACLVAGHYQAGMVGRINVRRTETLKQGSKS